MREFFHNVTKYGDLQIKSYRNYFQTQNIYIFQGTTVKIKVFSLSDIKLL